jgi:hypothetical protein
VLNFIKWKLLDIKGQIGPCTVIVTDFNTSFSSMDRASRQDQQRNFRVNWELNWAIGQMDLIDTCRIVYPAVEGYTLFLAAHGIFFEISHFRP